MVDGQFLSHPMNQTVMIGDIAEFECSSRNCDGGLRIYVNDDVQVAPRNDLVHSLNSREYNVTINNCKNGILIGTFWIYVNNRTLHQVRRVTCRIDGVNTIFSEIGYIVVESICTPCSTDSERNLKNNILDANHTNCSLLVNGGFNVKQSLLSIYITSVSLLLITLF